MCPWILCRKEKALTKWIMLNTWQYQESQIQRWHVLHRLYRNLLHIDGAIQLLSFACLLWHSHSNVSILTSNIFLIHSYKLHAMFQLQKKGNLKKQFLTVAVYICQQDLPALPCAYADSGVKEAQRTAAKPEVKHGGPLCGACGTKLYLLKIQNIITNLLYNIHGLYHLIYSEF